MTTQEFSNMFDTLLNSYNTEATFGEAASKVDIVLDEYEKSVLLTQAQDFIVKSYFDGTLNYQGQGFDDSTRRQVDFSTLIKVSTATKTENGTPFDSRGILYTMPKRVLFILNEKVTINGKDYVVVPINYKEYDRQMSKAFTQPLKKQCWRLFQNNSNTDFLAEIIPYKGSEITKYTIRYIERPTPIVLADISADGLDIDGVRAVTECTLNPILHMDILNKAVELAITTRGSYADAMRRRNEEVKSKS